MGKGLFLVVWFLGIILTEATAQSRADRLFERGDYMGALKAYQKELEGVGDDGSERNDLLKMREANCFFHLNDVVRAGQVYKTVNPNLMGAEDLTYYAITLIHSGDYEQAAEQAELAESLGADPVIIERLRSSCEFAKEVAKEKPLYTANKTKIDFAGFSAGVTYYKGRSVILAAPGTGEGAVTDTRGYKVTRLYNAVFTGDGTSGRLIPFANELADKYHIGAVTFTKDYKRIYYTRTILKKDGSSILKLMTAEEVNGKWEQVQELNINSDDYSCAHPCLYKDSLLFFVSDMPGGIGGKDIYMTTVQGPECGEIVNLGEQVNTMFDELFPFVAEDGKLYFASNGHVGLGGLDVFVSERQPDGSWSEPRNMGRPVNSSMDDFALVFRDTTCSDGYVSTNRGGTGYNDFLFALKRLKENKVPERMLAQKKKNEAVTGQPMRVEKAQQVVPDQDMFTVDYQYAIQIGAFRNPVPRVFFEHFNNVKVYLGFDNVYRYTVGEYPEEQLAQGELPAVQQVVPDAFVMNVKRYVAQKKIQHDVRGDDIGDDELLLRRLRNYERAKKKQPVLPVEPTHRFLDKPWTQESPTEAVGYTIVLMSADKVFDPSEFEGIADVDVYAVQKGKYMYCTGMYATVDEANRQLNVIQGKGFKEAYVLRKKSGVFYSESAPAPKTAVPKKRNSEELKKILNF